MSRKLLAVLLLLPGSALAQTTALQNGIAVDVPESPEGTILTYSLAVPADMTSLRVIMTGGAGDADLYVHYSEPFFASGDPEADCESFNPNTTEEECVEPLPAEGTWYIQVEAFTDFGDVGSDGVRLVAVAAEELEDDIDRTPLLSGAVNSQRWFYIDVPASQGHLNVTTSGGIGNSNLSVGPDLFAGPECIKASGNTADACEIDQPAAGPWYIRVTGATEYSGVILNAEYGPEPGANAGDASGGPITSLTLGALLLAGFAAAIRRRGAGYR